MIPSTGGRAGRRQRRQKRIKPRQAKRALYVDFESRKVEGEAPVLLGVLYDKAPEASVSEWVLRQFVFDPACARVDAVAGSSCESSSTDAALTWLLSLSESERRHVVSWSRYDRKRIEQLTGRSAFRYRNAIPTAKRWRKQQRTAGTIDDGGPNELERYERLVGYLRPSERYGVGDAIAYIRGLAGVTAGAVDRWRCLVEHNRHDLLAMREVIEHAVGLRPPPGAGG